MLSVIRSAATAALTPIGLEPGRAVANARVAVEHCEAQQAEQYAHIVSRLIDSSPRDDRRAE